MTYVYKLLDTNDETKYVGITDNPRDRQRKHRLERGPCKLVILEEHESRFDAGAREVQLIEELGTHISNGGWNKTWGGEYANVLGVSRKGIGGREKGCYNPSHNPSPETRKLWSEQRKGKVAHIKYDEESVRKMVELYKKRPTIKGVGEHAPNGKTLSYERAFSKKYAPAGMTPGNAYKIITGKTIAWKHLL